MQTLNKRFSRTSRKARQAATAVEFAVVLPVVLTVFLGAIEAANLNFLRNMSNDVAFQVAREAIVPGADMSLLEANGVESLQAMGILGASLSTSETPDEKLRVDVAIPVDQNSWGILPLAIGSTVRESCELSLQLGAS